MWTMSQLTRAESQALLNACPDCGAKPHNPCRHLTAYRHDQSLKHPHEARMFRKRLAARPGPFRARSAAEG
jgi:hypothetical protein